MIMFIRRFKLFALGIDRRIPEKLTRGDLVQVKVVYLAKDLEIPRSKLRIKGDFDNKSRKIEFLMILRLSWKSEIFLNCPNIVVKVIGWETWSKWTGLMSTGGIYDSLFIVSPWVFWKRTPFGVWAFPRLKKLLEIIWSTLRSQPKDWFTNK